MSFRVEPVWRKVTPALERELLDLWQRNGALSDPERAAARARQAVCVGRDEAGRVCAVGTAELRVLPRLRQPTYYYRQFFDAAHRGEHQAIPFANEAKAILQQYNAGLERPESLGLLVEVESSQLAGRYTLAHLAVEVAADGVPRQPGGSGFAGSSLTPDEGVRRTAAFLGFSEAEAARLWSDAAREAFGLVPPG